MLRPSLVVAAATGLTLLSACSMNVGQTLGLSGPAPVASGIVVGEEPNAVQSAAAILDQGGTAADAATAMYFTLSVTYPVAAGLGGGGVCLVHDPGTAANEEIDFPARDAAGGGAYAIGGNVRGFALLQANYGTLPWQRDVADAEGLASTGFAISHALAQRLAASQSVIRLDANLAHEFLDETGAVRPAGAVVQNPDLAATLAQIRTDGPNGLYAGALADKIAAYSAQEGGAITSAELAAYQATTGEPRGMTLGNLSLYASSVPETSFSAAVFAELARGGDAAEAEKRAMASLGTGSIPADLGSTAFAARDVRGQAVACAVTMNGPFGSGHTAGDTGVVLARPASQEPLAAPFLSPAIAADGSGNAVFTGTAAGGPRGVMQIASALEDLSRGRTVTNPQAAASGTPTDFDWVNGIVCQGAYCSVYTDQGVGRAQKILP